MRYYVTGTNSCSIKRALPLCIMLRGKAELGEMVLLEKCSTRVMQECTPTLVASAHAIIRIGVVGLVKPHILHRRQRKRRVVHLGRCYQSDQGLIIQDSLLPVCTIGEWATTVLNLHSIQCTTVEVMTSNVQNTR